MLQPGSMSAARRTAPTLAQNICRGTIRQKVALGAVDGQCRRYASLFVRRDFTRWPFGLHPHARPVALSSQRPLYQSTTSFQGAGAQTRVLDPRDDNRPVRYHGPLTQTFRRLKMFSLASLGLTFTMTPFLFIVESSLPMSARIFLAATALSTSGISTALVGWCGAPYVVDLRRLTPSENGGIEGIEMTTLTLTLKKLITRVYDSDFLVPTSRPFAKWELPLAIQLSPPDEDFDAAGKAGAPGEEETVAETLSDKGEVIGRWIVKWGEAGTGSCRGTGTILRYFNVHEELL